MNPSKYAPSQYGINDLIRRRFSPVGFSTAPLDTTDLLALLEAATWAPCADPPQLGRFVVGIRDTDDSHARILATLNPAVRAWAQRAPVLALAVTRAPLQPAHGGDGTGVFELGAATALLALEATARGLFVHPINEFDAAAASVEFAIPEPFIPIAALAIGHLAAPESLNDTLRERDTQPRSRPAPQDIAFSGTWEEPLAVNPEDAASL